MSYALKAASVTIQSLLQQSFAADPALHTYFASGAIVSLDTPDQMDAAGQFGLSIWLYRLVRGEQTVNLPPWRPSPGVLRRQPSPVRLCYLMTPIISNQSGGGTPETEQHVLALDAAFLAAAQNSKVTMPALIQGVDGKLPSATEFQHFYGLLSLPQESVA
jgi:hypothetical protein